MLLKDTFSYIGMMCTTNENVLVCEIFQALPFNEKFWGVGNFQMRILLMISLCGSGYDGTFDDGSKAIGQGIKRRFNDACIARSCLWMRRGWNSDVREIDVVRYDG